MTPSIMKPSRDGSIRAPNPVMSRSMASIVSLGPLGNCCSSDGRQNGRMPER
jgi:hypothetical protein